jgi:hypothetical protein
MAGVGGIGVGEYGKSGNWRSNSTPQPWNPRYIHINPDVFGYRYTMDSGFKRFQGIIKICLLS